MCNRVSGQTEASVYWWRRELKAGGVAGGEDQWGRGVGVGGSVGGLWLWWLFCEGLL